MDERVILKILMYIGGIIEVLLGVVFLFFIDFVMSLIQIPTFPLISQLAGIFALIYGILLLYATRDLEKYRIVPILNVILRFVMQVPLYLNMILFPQLSIILLVIVIYDLVWGISTLILLKKADLLKS